MKKLILLLLLNCAFFSLLSQPVFPDPGPLYDDNVVPRIDILIHPDSLDLIYEFPESNHEYPATFIFNNGTQNDTIYEIGFRLRGNTSRWSAKKSFKVSINSFHSGRKYYGVEKINLNGEHNDPTVTRAKLCWDYMREFEIVGPRANHVLLYINGNYHGLYANVEHIDEEFVESRYLNKDGNLYKCLWPADLNYLGNNPDLYKFENDDRRAYALKTNETEDDYSDLAHFIDVLNNTPIGDLPCELEKVFNVYDYLKVIAMDVTTSNWDGYIYNKNNFYLYHNTANGRFEYIPYDPDNTYGIDWFGVDWEHRNIYSWNHPDEFRPLFERILQVDKYRDQYSYYTHKLLTEIMEQNLIFPGINALRDKLFPYILNDPYYPLDYGYTPTDFISSYDQPTGGHDVSGLKSFITNRRTASLSQLVINNIYPVLNYAWNSPTLVGQEIWFRVFMENDGSGTSVGLILSVDGAPAEELPMLDDGQHNDYEVGDGYYGCSVGVYDEAVELSININAIDADGLQTLYYCEPMVYEVVELQISELFVNEFMADNESIIADEWGDFDDWLEIYNAGSNPVWLGDLFLTDNLTNKDKWKMPDYTMAPDSYVLIWADDEVEQGPFHASFKLSKDGEEIGIYTSPGTGSQAIDTYVFGPQTEDISSGRIPDGEPNWVQLEYATPGYSNESGAFIGEKQELPVLNIYPNPCNSGIIYFDDYENVRIYDLSGQLLLSVDNVRSIDVEGLEAGMYILNSEGHRHARLIIM